MTMWDSIETLSKLNYWIQVAIAAGGFLLAVVAGISVTLSSRITDLEKIMDKENEEKVIQLEKRLEQEVKKSLPVKDSSGKTHYLPLKVPPG